jgi:transposase
MPGWTFKSSDEEKRRLRCHLGRLQNSVQSHKSARQRLEEQNLSLKIENKTLLEQVHHLEEQLEEMKRQRDVYKNMIFKPNKKTDEENEKDSEFELNLPEQLKRKKKRGARKGHSGHGRKNPERIDETKRVHAKICPHCQKPLKRSDKTHSHLVEDLPSLENLKTRVTQFDIEEQWCTHCKKHVRAIAPGELPGSRLGIHLIVFVMILKYSAKTTWESIVMILSVFFKMNVTRGGLVNIMHRTKERLGWYYDEILNEIRKGKVKYADETTWRVDGINHWLWGFFNEQNAYYVVEESRGKSVPEKIFKDCYDDDHVLVRDDYAAYQKLGFRHQSCWAHLLRISHDASLLPRSSLEMKDLHAQLKTIFAQLSLIVEEPYVKTKRLEAYQKYKTIIEKIMAQSFSSKDSLEVQTRITNQGENLITALLYPNVPLTNNLSERCIRPFVVTRKISGGSRSKNGAKTHAVNMSVVQSIRMKNKPLVDTLQQFILDTSNN